MPHPYFPEDPGVQGRFREQEALVGACCITSGKVLGAVEERREQEKAMAPTITTAEPSQAVKSLSPGLLTSLFTRVPTWQTCGLALLPLEGTKTCSSSWSCQGRGPEFRAGLQGQKHQAV